MGDIALGIDIGTSGLRAAALDLGGRRIAFSAVPMPASCNVNGVVTQDPATWWQATRRVLALLGQQIDLARISAIAVDGTSGTILGVDRSGRPVTPGLMYNSRASAELVQRIADVAPREVPAQGAMSPLARAVAIQNEPGVARLIHQADWISGQFSGRFDVTDENNALKTGYDPVQRQWPNWIADAGMQTERLPTVVPAGTPLGAITRHCAHELGLAAGVTVIAGTTDGCAAFLATGASQHGDAVTSLGTTLVLKMLCDRPLFAPGVYSHRIGDRWIVGGASNSGGAAIARHFSLDQVRALSSRLNVRQTTGLDYYPLAGRGERFPIFDPEMEEKVAPLPVDDTAFLQALMEGVAEVERRGYRVLEATGAQSISSIRTVGGGAKDRAWKAIRERVLGVPLVDPDVDEAAFGVARLAWNFLSRRMLSTER